MNSSVEHLSPTTSSARFSLPSKSTAGPKPNIYERNLNKTRVAEVSAASLSFLFSEVVQYTQKRVSGVNDLERRYECLFHLYFGPSNLYLRRLNTLGYRVGTRVLELTAYRAESSLKAPKREIRLLPALMAIHTQIWRAVYGRPADAIEKSVENVDECTPFSLFNSVYDRTHTGL